MRAIRYYLLYECERLRGYGMGVPLCIWKKELKNKSGREHNLMWLGNHKNPSGD